MLNEYTPLIPREDLSKLLDGHEARKRLFFAELERELQRFILPVRLIGNPTDQNFSSAKAAMAALAAYLSIEPKQDGNS